MDTYFSTFPGYYDTMDAGVKDEHGYIKVSIIGSNTVGNILKLSSKSKDDRVMNSLEGAEGKEC